MPRPKKERTLLVIITLVYVVLGVTYALATPPLEASDEYKHYPVVQHIETEHALPVLDPENPGLWLQEAAQPPLYYSIMALLTSWINTSDLANVHQVNPHAFIGNPDQVANKNLIIHEVDRETYPWGGTILAVFIIRLASIALGVGTIVTTARLGYTLAGPKVGLLAAALTAFNPMFLFVSAAVNNDSLAIFLGSQGLYLLVRLWQDVPDPRFQWRRYLELGLVLGLGILTKLSLAGLLALTGVALAWLAWQRGEWRLFFVGGVVTAGVALVIPSWWFARNLQLYQDPLGLDVFFTVQGTRESPISWSDWTSEFGSFYRSFWGLFGGVNVAAPDLYYWICNLAAVVGAAGLVTWLRKSHSPKQRGLWLLPAWALIVFVLLLRWNTIYIAFQGRLIFPALSATSVLWAMGTLAWSRNRESPFLALVLSAWMLGAAITLPWSTIRPAYAYPEPLTTVPEPAQFGPITFKADDGEIQLVGVAMQTGQSVIPAGEPVKVTLYWQATDPVRKDYVSSVHLLGRDYASVGQINRYPGSGMMPTSRWQVGQIWRDEYHIYVDRDAMAPTRLNVSVGLYDAQKSSSLLPAGPDGAPMVLVIVGEARLGREKGEAPEPSTALGIALADGITLEGYSLEPQPAVAGDTLTLGLFWEASAQPQHNYTVFVHLLGRDDSQIAVADGPPAGGDYPTSLWQTGDQVEDLHVIHLPPDLPSGGYIIELGLYVPATDLRAVRLDNGDNSISLPVIVAERR